jgi:hypothetical protein
VAGDPAIYERYRDTYEQYVVEQRLAFTKHGLGCREYRLWSESRDEHSLKAVPSEVGEQNQTNRPKRT